MKKQALFCLLPVAALAFALSGCVVRTYPLARDRIDQDLSAGNRGYLKGEAGAPAERKTKRTTQIVEVELYSPIKFEKMSKARAQEKGIETETSEQSLGEGNRGYITGSELPQISEAQGAAGGSFEKYTVQKNDTLQKISNKFYGTTKRWTRIYEANKDTLSGPNRIYVGQVLNIPVEQSLGTEEKIK